jgi:CheY-like chemotaxis protein
MLGLPEALRTAIAGGRRPDVALVGHVRHDGADLSVARVVGADPLLADVPLVLVPMSGVRGRAREVREAGYRAYIPRPFQGNELLQCLRATVLKGRERPADNSLLITRHNVTDQSEVQPAGRVLVADDDPAGRQVACLQIARLGYLVDAVAGGKAAVAAAATGSYQLILMDCQMPDMDGLTATAAIRRNERPEQRTCIVALTADVSAVQRERCAEAGMDGFLEKPLRTQTLASLLTTHLRRGQEQSAIDVVDATALGLAEAGIEPEIALDLVREYLAGAAQTTEQLAQRRLDARSIHSAAHRLLGSARILGLARFERIWASLCDRTEHAGVEVPPAAIDDLREACADLTAWIESHQGRQHV